MQKQVEDQVICPISNTLLETMYSDLEIITHCSYGQCVACERTVAKSVLKVTPGKDPWPVIYEGAYCKKCYNKPIRKSKDA